MGEKGVLCHLTSLPDVSLEGALRFLAWLKQENIGAWQVLPITPPDEHGSPYASPSAFAAWPDLMEHSDLAEMAEDGYWLEDWGLYAAIKEEQGYRPWFEWPAPLRDRDPDALQAYRSKANEHIKRQRRFQSAWNQMKDNAKASGVNLVGDLPIFIAHDSADVWAHRSLFQLDESGMPTHVAGVPPDYFSEGGQKWGTVLYRWDEHQQDEWRWWKERMKRMLRLFDTVRIDHFRGIHSNWAVPLEDEDARNGCWQEGPKDALLEALVSVATSPSCILAEDLGIIPDEVISLRKKFALPGMAVLHFGFHGSRQQNPHHPHSIQSDQVVYTGTHDNDTSLGWWNNLEPEVKHRVDSLLKEGEAPVAGLIRMALESNARMAMIPLQDLMQLDTHARMNTPGTPDGNWKWSFSWTDLNNLHFSQP